MNGPIGGPTAPRPDHVKWQPAAVPNVWSLPPSRRPGAPLTAPTRQAAEVIYRDLCLFDEHTWGSSESVARPHSLDTWAQYNEKSRTAYRPMALAKLLLAQRARTSLYPREEGLYVANRSLLPWSGWTRCPPRALRSFARSRTERRAIDAAGIGAWLGTVRSPGRTTGFDNHKHLRNLPDNRPDRQLRFRIEQLEGQSVRRLLLRQQKTEPRPPPERFTVTLDEQGWPTAARWPAMEHRYSKQELAILVSLFERICRPLDLP